MLYPEDHSADLKRWIVKRLENTSDADADVLADYVLALLRHDGDAQDVRKLFESEIPDFLKEDSSIFVNDVFEAISQKAYLPRAAQPQPRQEAPVPSTDPYALSYDDLPIPRGPQAPPALNGPRKRPYNDQAGAQNGWDHQFDGRSFKQPRRGGSGFGSRGGRSEDANSFQGGLPAPFTNIPGQLPLQFPPPTNSGPMFNADALKAFFEMAPLGFPTNPAQNFAPLLQGQSHHQTRQKKPRCRDYDTKGYCSRGHTCMFEHGDDSIYIPPVHPSFGTNPPSGAQAVEEYDPSNALLPGMFNPGPGGQPHQHVGPDMGRPMYGRGGRQQGQQGQQPRRQRPKAPFSADGPVLDRTKSTIVVENIPEENFTEDQVREFFSQFGNILEISMQPYKRLAVVKFDNWGSANAAYKSPKVVFENRFVKIFWYKDDETSLPGSVPTNGAGTNGFKKAGSAAGHSDTGAGSTPPPEIDMEEFRRRQEEAQKAHEEKMRKLQEVDDQRQDLEKRQKALLAKQQEEKAKLMAKLAQKKSAGSEPGIKSQEGGEAKSTKPVSQSEALRAQLAALEAEAKQLGLDPDSMDESHSSWSPTGGSFSRGRGGYPYRARGFAPRGLRGGRGGRGNNHAAYAAYSLDNRPKKVILTGVDFTIPEKDETLRQYLFGVGEFTSIQTSPTSTDITFKDRKTAEKFFNDITLNNKEIHGINGQLELTWASASGTPVGGSAVSSTVGTPTSTAGMNAGASASGHDNHHHGGAGTKNAETAKHAAVTAVAGNNSGGTSSGSDDKDVNIILDNHHAGSHGTTAAAADQQQNDSMMDYDVADDNQWD